MDWWTREMFRLFLLCAVMCWGSVDCTNDAGKGLWSVQYFEKCENDDELKMKIELIQEKINRTHDGWTGHFVFEDPFTEGFSVSVEIRQLVDGGYRLINEINEPELLDFLTKYAEKNVQLALIAAGIDPPEFPVNAGEYDLDKFIFDYTELDENGFYGEYSGQVVVKHGLDIMFCIIAYVEFSE